MTCAEGLRATVIERIVILATVVIVRMRRIIVMTQVTMMDHDVCEHFRHLDPLVQLHGAVAIESEGKKEQEATHRAQGSR